MTHQERLKQIFEDCTLTHPKPKEYWLTLPEYTIEDYPKFKKMITDVGGQWKRKGFLFTSNPQKVLGQIFQQGINWKKLTQFYATPHPVCRQMFEALPSGKEYWFNKRILEPSAGRGNILMEILLRTCLFQHNGKAGDEFKLIVSPQSQVDICEIDPFNYLCLENKIIKQMGYQRVCGDFMDLPLDNRYDVILANPPFNKDQYKTHYQKMVEHLTPGGDMVCILPKKAQDEDIYAGLQDVSFSVMDNHEFRSSGTQIDTVMVVARRIKKATIMPTIHAVGRYGQLSLFS